MAHLGKVGNYNFDPDIFTGYMAEKAWKSAAVIASGIMATSDKLQQAVGGSGNIGTMPIWRSVDTMGKAKNFDGDTDNTPEEYGSNKQTFMRTARMAAWTDKDFERYLIGKEPLTYLADNLVAPFYVNTWQDTLIQTMEGCIGATGMETHKTKIGVTDTTVTEQHKLGLTSLIEAAQKACGDKAKAFSLVMMHSAVYTNLKAKNLIEMSKYTIAGAAEREIELPTFNGYIVSVDDALVDLSNPTYPLYHTFLAGRGSILTCNCDIPTPYYMDYDGKTKGGVTTLYTKQSKLIHPNGFSLKTGNIVKESPTDAELGNSANWELVMNQKNIALAEIISNG